MERNGGPETKEGQAKPGMSTNAMIAFGTVRWIVWVIWG
jgi:hypothetical protein